VRADLEDYRSHRDDRRDPAGLAINAAGTRVFVTNFISRSVTTVDITNPTAPTILSTSPAPSSEEKTKTRRPSRRRALFQQPGPQGRMSSEGWGSCVACHPAGRTDNVTWMFDAGPRQTIPLDGTFNHVNPEDHRALNWSAVRDEVQDFELNTETSPAGAA
jgi:hypothetical protein